MDDPTQPLPPTEEPSVLDYLKSKLSLRRGTAIHIPQPESYAAEPQAAGTQAAEIAPVRPAWQLKQMPWRSLTALIIALFAQFSLEPRLARDWKIGAVFYVFALGWLIWAALSGEWALQPHQEEESRAEPGTTRLVPLAISLIFSLAAFLDFKGNLFTSTNLFLWAMAIATFILAFWVYPPDLSSAWRRLIGFFKHTAWVFQLEKGTLRDWLLVAGIALLVIFYRAAQINQVPLEMISDHAEKLLDVNDVLQGQTHIFFPRNTGREAFQFYLIALTAKVFGTGISFLSMKIGAILFGLLTLPFIYGIGKEIAGKRAGFLAVAFAGIAYWPNVISRIALRFTFYPFFVAMTLYFFIRGLRTSRRNDFILAGISLGIGLHSYTPIRILPLVVLIGFLLFLIHSQSKGNREASLFRFAVLVLAAVVLFLPLFRFAAENPEMFSFRAFSRLSDWEHPLPGAAWLIFLKNLWNAMAMFGWNNGNVWASSIPYRPALDVIAASLFYLGFALLTIRYLLRRHWLDLFLLLSVPLLMLPSILSLAFPEENPNLSRTAGALVPAFVIIGMCVDALLRGMSQKIPSLAGKRLAWGVVGFLFFISCLQNYNLVFTQYRLIFQLSSWNTTEMGKVVRAFTESMGSPANVWAVAYPHWADSRLVAINSGYPALDYGIYPERLAETQNNQGAKLFLLYPPDDASLNMLKQLYPQGWLQTYDSPREGKDFLIYLVPPE